MIKDVAGTCVGMQPSFSSSSFLDRSECSDFGCNNAAEAPNGSVVCTEDATIPNERTCTCPEHFYAYDPNDLSSRLRAITLIGSASFRGCYAICGDGNIIGPEEWYDFKSPASNSSVMMAIRQIMMDAVQIARRTHVTIVHQLEDLATVRNLRHNNLTTPAICGDGFVVFPLENCDFGGDPTTAGDGCLNCQLELGWQIDGCGVYPICGDGLVLGEEQW